MLDPEQLQSDLSKWGDHVDRIKYACWQVEMAPSTGQLHVQAAVRFVTALRAAAVKKLFPKAHLEVAGNWEKLKEYCTKEESRVLGPWVRGMDPGSGHRSDLDLVAEDIKSGVSLRDIALRQPATYVRNYKGLAALQSLIHQPPAIERSVALFVGPTATGKTRMVYDNLEDVYSVFCIKAPWFDGYTGQKHVVLDECGPGMMNHNFLKRLLDRYPMTVPVKGGSAAWMAERIVLTSNVPIEQWFDTTTMFKGDFDALKRRIRVFNFPEDKWLADCWIKGAPAAQQIVAPVAPSREPTLVLSDDEQVYDITDDEEPILSVGPDGSFARSLMKIMEVGDRT